MRIEKVEASTTTILSNLNPGDVFMYDYEYYIKTPVKTNGDSDYEVVNLDTGMLETLGCEIIVERVNAKLVVEG